MEEQSRLREGGNVPKGIGVICAGQQGRASIGRHAAAGWAGRGNAGAKVAAVLGRLPPTGSASHKLQAATFCCQPQVLPTKQAPTHLHHGAEGTDKGGVRPRAAAGAALPPQLQPAADQIQREGGRGGDQPCGAAAGQAHAHLQRQAGQTGVEIGGDMR